jgi:hypothetical protein
VIINVGDLRNRRQLLGLAAPTGARGGGGVVAPELHVQRGRWIAADLIEMIEKTRR